jgi:hypothetical protein
VTQFFGLSLRRSFQKVKEVQGIEEYPEMERNGKYNSWETCESDI